MNKVTGRVNEHDCRMNWGGSSKTIKNDLAVEMLVPAFAEKSRISIVIMDEDSTTMCQIR